MILSISSRDIYVPATAFFPANLASKFPETLYLSATLSFPPKSCLKIFRDYIHQLSYYLPRSLTSRLPATVSEGYIVRSYQILPQDSQIRHESENLFFCHYALSLRSQRLRMSVVLFFATKRCPNVHRYNVHIDIGYLSICHQILPQNLRGLTSIGLFVLPPNVVSTFPDSVSIGYRFICSEYRLKVPTVASLSTTSGIQGSIKTNMPRLASGSFVNNRCNGSTTPTGFRAPLNYRLTFLCCEILPQKYPQKLYLSATLSFVTRSCLNVPNVSSKL